MSDILNSYRELNLNNYDSEDVSNLHYWSIEAYDEISSLQDRLLLANRKLKKINDLAEEQ